MNKQQFINAIAASAVTEAARSGIPASVTIAQAILESNWGKSGLAAKAYNLFGMKGTGPAGSITMPTTEYIRGKPITVNAAFRAYHNWGESITDHIRLLLGGVSWNRNLYAKVRHTDAKTAARALQSAGYATDPNYASKLIQLMDTYNLYQYDTKRDQVEENPIPQPEEDEPMTKEERALMEALQQKLDQQEAQLKRLQSREEMPCPAWAQEAYEYFKPYIADAKGSYNFWRVLVVLYRKGKAEESRNQNES